MLSVDPTRCAIGRQNVLLLGISYPCVPSQMTKHGFPQDVLTYKEPSVEQAVECVRRGILTEMDARDLARCVATEQATNTHVYTVSREIGAEYRSDRHVHCDFNARNFCQTLQKQFGRDIKFSQVILDYYWMPTGWLVTRWAKTLFQQTLPDLVRHKMLTFPSKRRPQRRINGPPYDIDEGVVFLPFCAHVCKELVGAIHILKDYYEITFLDKKDLHGHSLWKGTMEIDANVMQTRLGKRLDQEEIYCKFRPKDIYESMEDPHVNKPDVMRILLAIKNYDDIRMVRLRPLRQHEPVSVFRQRLYEHEKERGGFMGLDFALSKRLMSEMKKGSKKKNTLSIEEEKKEDDTVLAKKKVETPTQKGATTKETTKTVKPNKQKEARPVIRKALPKPTLCAEVETPDPEELERFQFFPGPARDLSTYIEPEEMAAEDEELLRRTQKKFQRQKKSLASRNSFPSQAKGVVILPGDETLVKQRKKPIKFKIRPQRTQYLSFNPRQPRAQHGDNIELLELDWTIIPEDDGDPVHCPTLADALDLQAASTLYHCILKGLQTRNKEVDGTERVARIDLNGREETTCFAIDEGHREYKELTGYTLQPSEKLAAAMKKAEIPLRAIIEASHGFWEPLLDVDDRIWLAKVSKKRSLTPISYGIKVADGSIIQVLVDRVQNLNSIVRWLLFDQNDADDPSCCFRLIKFRLVQSNPGLANAPIGKLAWAIEKELNAEIKLLALSAQNDHGARSGSDDSLLRHALETFLGIVLPSELDFGDAVKIMLSLRQEIDRERTNLRRDVMKWLDSGKDSDDPTGEFRQVSKMPKYTAVISDDHGERTKDERASEICARVASLRNVVSYFEEEDRTSIAHDPAPIRKLERRRRKPKDQVESDFLDSLAMLHMHGVSSKGSPASKSSTCTRQAGLSKYSRQSVLATCTTPPILGKGKSDVAGCSSLALETFDVTASESQHLNHENVSGRAASADEHSMSTNYDHSIAAETILAQSSASPQDQDALGNMKCTRVADDRSCEITREVVKKVDEKSVQGYMGAAVEDTSPTVISLTSNRKSSKRKHKGSDSLLDICPDSPLSERSRTSENCSVKRIHSPRTTGSQLSVLVSKERVSKKRKMEHVPGIHLDRTKIDDVEDSWNLEGPQPSKRFVSPAESGTNSRVSSPTVSDADDTTLAKPTERRPRIKNRMFEILGRLTDRDISLNKFVVSAGITKEEYTTWIEHFGRLYGSHRAAILDRICSWFGSNQQLSDSLWERMVFEVINQNVSGCDTRERAIGMEHLMFMFQETLDELRGLTANADLKETLNHRIKNLKSSNTLVHNPIHLPLSHPSRGAVTMMEHGKTGIVAGHQPIVLRTHQTMEHFSSPKLVGVDPDILSDMHGTVGYSHRR